MARLKLVCLALTMAAATPAVAGGINTNTNQNVAFLRNCARDAVIGIDGAYFNPAGVVFLPAGLYVSNNWQIASQTRTINNDYALFTNNVNNPTTPRDFKGKAFVPVLPSFQVALNRGRFSFQSNLSVGGGGGKCEFKDGLGSFERIVSETAMAACGLAGAIDQTTGMPMFTSDKMFGSKGSYSFSSYMRGRQYYYGLSLGAAYKITDNLSAYAGVRGVYALCNYYGYVRNIQVGNVPLYSVLDPSKPNAADIELSCDQQGIGFTPIISVDYRLGRWNFAAKYEFKTRLRLKNSSVNQVPSIGNLPANLQKAFEANGVPAAQAEAILSSPKVAGTMAALKTQFDAELGQAIGQYEDGKKIAGDLPAILTAGVEYNPIDPLRLSVGFHYYWDKQASQYLHKEDKLDRGTIEYNAGAELDASKLVTVSAGWQRTSYGLTPEYMEDQSFVTSSNSLGCGVKLHVSKKVSINAAYFITLYGHEKTTETSALNVEYKSDYHRTNNVWGVGVDLKL